jgi:xyloglucan-specific exo-beta-1,4-glucanase
LGYNTGVKIAADGSWMLTKTDVGGFYRRAAGESAHTQIVGSAGFPSTLSDPQNFTTSGGNSPGVWDIAISRSSPSTAYAVFKAKVVKTTNSGVNWSITNFAVVGGGSNDFPPNQQAFERLVMNKMVVDPNDPNTVLLWSPTTGPYRTTNGGSAWTQPTGLPSISGQATGDRVGLFACDEGSTVGAGRVWFAFAQGSGLYRSTDNGATWASAGTGFGTYTSVSDLVYRSPGVVWLADRVATEDNVAIWTQGSGYTTIATTPAGFRTRYITIDPNDTNDLIFSAGGSSGQFIRSKDGGSTWTAQWGTSSMRSQHVETRIMSFVQDVDNAAAFSWSFAKPAFHPTDGYLYWPTGYGMCRTLHGSTAFNAPNSGDKLIINDFAAGEEELVAMFGRIKPDHTLLLASQDKCFITVTDPTTYALPSFPRGIQLANGYYVDYVDSDPTKVAFACGGNIDGYSDDGGTTGTTFTTQPILNIGGGSILRLDDTHFYRALGQNRRPRYSDDKGVTWNIPTFTGGTLPADGVINGFGSGLINFNHRCVTKDVASPNILFTVNYGEGGTNTMMGAWKSVDYGATWTHQNSSLILASGQQGGHMTLIHADGVLYYTSGSTGSGYTQETTSCYLFRSSDDGVTWTAIRTSTGFVQEVTEVLQICWGAPLVPGGNKTIWIAGWVDHVLGIWYSTDKGLTWTKSSDLPNFDSITYIAADPVTFGRLTTGGSGSGHRIRT